MDEYVQRESPSRRRVLALAAGATFALLPAALADTRNLDAAGATFRDYARFDNGASFYQIEGVTSGGAASDLATARLMGVDNEKGVARVRFNSVKTELSLPLGWQAGEDWERGVAYSADKRYRLIVWRVDFAFEGVRDAEHYAATKSGSIQARRPRIQAQARKLGDGTFLVIYQNVEPARGDSEMRVVFDVLITQTPSAKEGALLTLGVPVSEAERGLRLMALMKASIKVDW